MKKSLRFDIARLDAPRRDQNGYLEASANVTRTGVFVYRHPDGTVTRELRHPDDVLKADSLETLKNRPVTLGHPAVGKLTTKNTRQYAVGTAIGDVKHDGKYVQTRLLVTDEDAISLALDEKNPVREVSCGYDAEVFDETGTYFDAMTGTSEQYTHRQKNIVYNHVALVRRGRAGGEVRLQLDSIDGEHAVMERGDEHEDAPNWEEQKHPRANDGKFGHGGGAPPKKKGKGQKPPTVADLAREHFPQFETLETRNSDSDDFREVHVKNVTAGLAAAHKAGGGSGSAAAVKMLANRHFPQFKSLKEQNSDREDFKDTAVWQVNRGLQAAMSHGAREAAKKARGEANAAKATQAMDEHATNARLSLKLGREALLKLQDTPPEDQTWGQVGSLNHVQQQLEEALNAHGGDLPKMEAAPYGMGASVNEAHSAGVTNAHRLLEANAEMIDRKAKDHAKDPENWASVGSMEHAAEALLETHFTLATTVNPKEGKSEEAFREKHYGGDHADKVAQVNKPKKYSDRVRELEGEGLNTSDAQGVVDTEIKRGKKYIDDRADADDDDTTDDDDDDTDDDDVEIDEGDDDIDVRVSAGARESESTTTREVSGVDGVKMIYSCATEEKTIRRFVFSKSEGWTIENAKAWAEKHRNDSVDSHEDTEMNKIKIRRDAIATKTFKADAFDVSLDGTPESSEKAFDMLMVRLDAAVSHIRTLEATNDTLQGRVDAAGHQEGISTKQVNLLAKERADIEGVANYVGLKNFGHLENPALKKAVVIKCANGAIDPSRVSNEEYIQGRYDSVVENIRRERGGKAGESLAILRDVVTEDPGLLGLTERQDSVSPRDKLAAETANMWQDKPPGGTA